MAANPTSAFDRAEPIPGYRTVDLLGRGGYGEVWRVIAPGGIEKAVKIVYGDNDASHAATEMRALARIKDVRHPLLLSIERIEVTHGNLVIVTELADQSLKQRFTQCKEEGKDGIPLEELLGYLNDTADALDYLYDRYSLQHLDVKPENILLLGNRAKVGDFGLVKNLYERSASMVGGLTPTYAPPELFEGKPSRHSDQYGLAIVYVQMLTGMLPFNAGNVAQLASLHLRGVPDLAALPKRQRTVIARALSKDPGQRYESCMAMVRALREATRELESNASRSANIDGSSAETTRPGTGTIPLPAQGATATRFSSIPSQPTPTLRTSIAASPSAGSSEATFGTTDPAGWACPPTILVGIGGAGVQILAHLVRRLNDRFGSVEQWPPVEILAFDSNTKALGSQFQDDELARVRPIPIPLKPAESYGSQSGEFLRWLGRRWFYNIPRDLTTGGYRPLGRLALLTHARRVRDEIHASVGRTAQRCAQAKTAKSATVCPRVILVGSISGGTSGGAMIDLTYAIRGELKRRGLSDDQIHGVLLHATPRISAERDKARANAYATLRELDHFSRPGGHYPGEPHLSAPPFHGDNAVFSQAHFLNLGEGLGQLEWEMAADQISEFIYSTTFSAAGRILDAQCAAEGDAAGAASILPHEVLSLSTGTSPILVHAARVACADVLRLWGEGHEEKNLASGGTERTAIMNSFTMNAAPRLRQIEDAARHKLVELKFDADRLLKDAIDALNREIGTDTDRVLTRVVDETLNATADEGSGAARTDLIFDLLDRYLQSESQSTSDQFSCDALYVQIEGRLAAHARSGIEPLMSWLRGLVDARETRIEGARQSAVAVQRQMQALSEGIVAQAAEHKEKALAIALEFRSADNQKANQSRFSFSFRKKDPNDRFREMLKPYAQARIQEMLRRAAAKMGRIVVAEISTFIEQLDRLSRGLDQLPEPIRELAVAPADDELPSSTPPVLAAFRETMGTQLVLRREDIARQIESQLDQKLFSAEVRLSNFLSPEFELRRMLWRPLADAARETVLAAIRDIFRKIVAGHVPLYGGDLISLLSDEVRREPHAGRSPVAGRVLIVPDEVDPNTVRDRLQSTLSNTAIVPGGKCDVTLWTVRRPTSHESVALTLIGGNPQYAELASRLHSRVDITWQPFSTPKDNSAPSPSPEPSAPMLTHTAVIRS